MPARCTSFDYTQVLDDHQVLASIGSVGDAYDNALAESFVDSYKTELISDRVWRTRAQVELATVEWVAWFNHERLHEALGDIPPVEFEHNHAVAITPMTPISGNGSVASTWPRPADGLTTRRFSTLGVDSDLDSPIGSENRSVVRALTAQAAPQAGRR
jgi:putative transposase